MPAEDARRAIAIGPHGEVYEPDGTGTWVRHLRVTIAEPVSQVSRAGASVIASGGGVIYRLAANGWSAVRLAQHGKAVVGAGGAGDRGTAAVGRTLYALDHTNHGEPIKLAEMAAPILAIGSGPKPLVLTDGGLAQLVGTKVTAIKNAPAQPRLISDRWILIAGGAIDVVANKPTTWPSGVSVSVAAPGPGTALTAIGVSQQGLELLTIDRGKLARDPIEIGLPARAVGLVVDRAGRAAVAFSDGRLVIRDRGGWTATRVRDDLPGPRPGSAPARSP